MLRDCIPSCCWCICRAPSFKLWNEKKHISGFLRQLFFSSSFPGNFLSQSEPCLRCVSVQGNIKGTKVLNTKERICRFVFQSVQLRGVVKRRGARASGIWTISNSMFDITFISAFAKFGFSRESALGKIYLGISKGNMWNMWARSNIDFCGKWVHTLYFVQMIWIHEDRRCMHVAVSISAIRKIHQHIIVTHHRVQ